MARRPPDDQAPDPAEVLRIAQRAGGRLDEAQADKLARYLGLLMRWNRKLNLVGPSHWREVLETLVPDSFHLPGFLDELGLPAGPLCLDFGAGAGLPGIPLRILRDAGEHHLVEPREKRAVFLQRITAELGLQRTFVHRTRVQGLDPALASADAVMAKAFLPWPQYAALAREWVRPGGAVIVLASHPAPDAQKLAAQAPGLALVRESSYRARGERRYFWGLTPASASS
jgi:16S rRNA (guanine527-N7)-methyltransferase